MREIRISEPPKPDADYSYIELNSSHYDELLSENVTVLDHEGKIAFVLLKKVLSTDAVASYWDAIKDWWPMTSQRGLAQGYKQEYRYKDGKKTNYKKKRSYACSGVMGYYDPFPTMPACRPCAWNAENPKLWRQTFKLSQEVAKIHKEFDPSSFATYEEIANRTHPDFKVPETPYTTMTVNKNFRTFPHKDGFNLHATCPMTVIRKGKYGGGFLVFPDYRLAVHIDTFDLILFMNSTLWHGNTAITGMTEDSVRSSTIWYYRKNMVECGSMADELNKLRNAGLGGLDK